MNNRTALGVISVVLFSLVIYGGRLYFKPSHLPKVPSVRLVYIPTSSGLPFFVADHKGYLKLDGAEVVVIRAESPSEAINLILAGRADIAIQLNMSGVFGALIASPNTFKCFMPTIETDDSNFDYILVPEASSISAPEDFRGKTIGLRQGPTDLLLAQLYLRKHGIDAQKDVILLQMQSKQLLDGLHSKSIDAAFTNDPDATIGINNLKIVTFKRFYRGELLNPFPATCNLVRTKFVNENPALFEHVVIALKRAINDINKDLGSSLTVMPHYTPIEPKLASKVGVPVFSTDYMIYTELLQKLANVYEEGKAISHAPSINKIFISTPD